jgi:redox-sensitive bicupin YhaK (pirin superfamily)
VKAHHDPGAALEVDGEHAERAVYVAAGVISLAPGGPEYGEGTLLVLPANERVELFSSPGARVMLLGGAPLAGARHIYWNFVSSSLERLEKAKGDWQDGRFAKIPGDDVEYIPLPET